MGMLMRFSQTDGWLATARRGRRSRARARAAQKSRLLSDEPYLSQLELRTRAAVSSENHDMQLRPSAGSTIQLVDRHCQINLRLRRAAAQNETES